MTTPTPVAGKAAEKQTAGSPTGLTLYAVLDISELGAPNEFNKNPKFFLKKIKKIIKKIKNDEIHNLYPDEFYYSTNPELAQEGVVFYAALPYDESIDEDILTSDDPEYTARHYVDPPCPTACAEVILPVLEEFLGKKD
jgi:hypothetical protein